ncbi:DUF3800 domain-containing protein [Aerococcus urinae]|uniref:DUF3800 domain-containing protein n=1 Tax=Aerococcus mictus TaxID=2976810 RepID=A0A1E9P9E9_9LACT|nr:MULTISPECIES: DUF3800 domain-containing protein [Aerococcus]KAA9291515.1 DUF3800 domain-containing protein [Aerococcus mictus]MBU5610204.1 DUF3800 domain-containing protein [Aerococcus urinae]MCY3034815.1 DUF3800 domain-containing protein [Aerococcus mictus]MCY3064149.1 DUF3800 domain-containing protein [Aerococcus mictus]MCY3064828.1 DUF3800 domain-containing protein [Aerococcus mictus]
MQLFVDESGMITTDRKKNSRYFVMAFAETADQKQVRSVFRQAKKEYLDQHPESNLDIHQEIKGSMMPNGMKAAVFDALTKETDLTFHYLVIDNFQLYDNLLRIPALTFNYFIGLAVGAIVHSHQDRQEKLYLMIDNRNQAIQSLNSLEEYLQIKFTIEKRRLADVQVEYQDSKERDMIQVADIFANTVFRIARNEANGEVDQVSLELLDHCRIGGRRFFPLGKNNLDFMSED